MPLPIIHLRQCQQTAATAGGIRVPGKSVEKYHELKSLAYEIAHKLPESHDVVFHLNDDDCDVTVWERLWDEGAYFDENLLDHGKLHIFAHFTERAIDSAVDWHMRTASVKDKLPEIQNSRLSRYGSSVHSKEDSVGITVNLAPQPLPHSTINIDTKVESARAPSPPKAQDRGHPFTWTSDSDDGDVTSATDEPNSDDDSSFGGTDNEVDSDNYYTHDDIQYDNVGDGDGDEEDYQDERETHRAKDDDDPKISSSLQRLFGTTSLSEVMKQRNKEFNTLKTTNAPPGQYGHKPAWDTIGDRYRVKIAHARLIKGRFGTPAPVACERCLKTDRTCRVYLPELQEKSSACGECQLQSGTCVMGGQNQLKRRARTSLSNVRKRFQMSLRNAKKRPHTSLNETGDWLCAFDKDCPRKISGFPAKERCVRHMRRNHDMRNIPPIYRHTSEEQELLQSPANRKQSSLACPVPGYTSRSADGFSHSWVLRQHIQKMHPSYVQPDDLNVDVSSQYTDRNSEQTIAKLSADTIDPLAPVGRRLSSSAGEPSAGEPSAGWISSLRLRCPVQGCDEGAFVYYFDLLRHMNVEHPSADQPLPDKDAFLVECPMETTRQVTRHRTFQCPVQVCSASHPHYEGLRRHVNRDHSFSNHAQVLRAVFARQPLKLCYPAPPSQEEYSKDIAAAETNPPKSGEYAETWQGLQTKTKRYIAHSRLIQDRYGVLAPVPCIPCRQRGTTCLVYHPHVFGESFAPPRSSCSMCMESDSSSSCHMSKTPFKRYLLPVANADLDLYYNADGPPLPDRTNSNTRLSPVGRLQRRRQVDLDSDDI